jgi:uncharacterized alkaline shock family protein YloU
MRADAKVNLGIVQVHKRVIADICAVATLEVEGISLARNKTLEGFLGFWGVRYNSSVEVVLDANAQVSVIIKVVVRYGMNLSDISRRVQDVVMTAVERMTDINLKDVDVSIQGIERE